MPTSHFLELKIPLNESIQAMKELKRFFERNDVMDHDFDVFVNDWEVRIFIFLMTEHARVLDLLKSHLKSMFPRSEVVESTLMKYRNAARKRMQHRVIEETSKQLLAQQQEQVLDSSIS